MTSLAVTLLSTRSTGLGPHLRPATFANANAFPTTTAVALVDTIALAVPTIPKANTFPSTLTVELTDTFDLELDAPLANENGFPDTTALTFSIALAAPTIANDNAFPDTLTVEFAASEFELLPPAISNANDFPTITVDMIGIVAPAWRINVLTVATAGNPPDIAEIEFRDAEGGADAATGGTAIESGHASTNVAANGFDNDALTRWVSNANNTGWLGYEFASATQLVVEVAITMAAAVTAGRIPATFNIEWRDDDGVWHIAWTVGESATSGWAAGETRVFSMFDVPGDLRTTQIALEVMTGETAVLRTTQMAIEAMTAFPPADPEVVPEDEPTPPATLMQAWNVSGADYNTNLNVQYLQARRTLSVNTDSANKCVRAFNPIYGKRCWEVLVIGTPTSTLIGLGQKIAGVTLSEVLGADLESIGYRADGHIRRNGVDVSTSYPTYANGDRIMVCFDQATNKVWFGKNGVMQGNPAAGTGEAATMAAGWYYPMDHVINSPLYKLTSFTGYAEYQGTTLFTPSTPPSGFSYFDPVHEN